MINNILLTGDLQVGKSTIINQIVPNLGIKVGGFITQRYYEQEQLVGFCMESLNHHCLSEEHPLIGHCKDHKWVAVKDTFEHDGVVILRECLQTKAQLIIMDELGFFENEAYEFQNMVNHCLDSEVPVLGVLKQHNTPFLDSIKERKDLVLLTVTPANRERIADTVDLLLEEILVSRCTMNQVIIQEVYEED